MGSIASEGFDDELMRACAFEHVKRLQALHGTLSSSHLRAGFTWNGQRFPLINPQRGIFKPAKMQYLLSILTAFPRTGARVWYDDQRRVHEQIFQGSEFVDYAFMGDNPEAAENKWLKTAWENRVPIVYFLGVSPGNYEVLMPAFVAGWDPAAMQARIAFAMPGEDVLAVREPERRYAFRVIQQRLHQASFRAAVIAAYGSRCALSGLPEPMLLDAAHIVSDREEQLGQPVVPNGLPLSKIHHAAFDSHLIGIDADYRVHVSKRLLVQRDGPMLEALKQLSGIQIHLPRRQQDRPDRERLEQRFREFANA
jgi:putative restriction endonuclease